ncbi:S-adenosyl-L-methionine-dependent methyltransferase [Zopfia rhizophila CBS 207.26]|uniref:S-adenosyl-L-methionine-dependent methyltransferase n=1 Tax=Zopfia rhizophila CBS 207.26 TaxID=1314779 RepID=A0A6A6DW57_9PEZI|nr:S-adenosyl-L-methionine-dependent methyltransferase [Zopfia rhizophila CBS 207.26]
MAIQLRRGIRLLSSFPRSNLPSPLVLRTSYQIRSFSKSYSRHSRENGAPNPIASANIGDLSSIIQENTKIYHDYLISQKLPLPSHNQEYTVQFPLSTVLPEDIIEARDKAINASQELSLLLGGPHRNIISGASEQFMAICLHFICRHNFPTRVPIDGTISVDDLAKDCGLDREDTLRTLRCAQAWHLFSEPEEGRVAHTAASRLLRDNERFRAWITNVTEEVWPSISHLVDAMDKWPGSEDPAKTAWSLAHGTDESVFTNWNRHPEKAASFVTAMSFWNTAPGFEARHILNQFDFSLLPTPALWVDMGGSLGHAAKEVARAHPHVKTIVQDLPATIEGVPKDAIPEELKGRVQFMPHDFFNAQPVIGADVYYFRAVMHDWSDETCITILENLIPAMKKGARVLVTDTCVPRFGEVSMMEERRIRSLDMTMKAFANAKERSTEDWGALFRAADKRFGQFKVQLPKGSQRLALMSVVWEP